MKTENIVSQFLNSDLIHVNVLPYGFGSLLHTEGSVSVLRVSALPSALLGLLPPSSEVPSVYWRSKILHKWHDSVCLLSEFYSSLSLTLEVYVCQSARMELKQLAGFF